VGHAGRNAHHISGRQFPAESTEDRTIALLVRPQGLGVFHRAAQEQPGQPDYTKNMSAWVSCHSTCPSASRWTHKQLSLGKSANCSTAKWCGPPWYRRVQQDPGSRHGTHRLPAQAHLVDRRVAAKTHHPVMRVSRPQSQLRRLNFRRYSGIRDASSAQNWFERAARDRGRSPAD
jgi:hypothetical protein